MNRTLRPLLLVLGSLPFGLAAQVLAGDPSGLLHTSAGILLAPPVAPFPSNTEENASIDLQGDGSDELIFTSGNIHAFDADGSFNAYGILHEGVEVAVTIPDGYMSRRLGLSDPIDASLDWRAWGGVGINSGHLAYLLTNFGGQWDTTGSGQWFFDAATATQGYFGVRIVEAEDTLYGWLNLTSFVSQDSAWLRIEDFAIETGTTGIGDLQDTEDINVVLLPTGVLMVRGGESEVLLVTLRDMSGRLVQRLTGHSPCSLNLATEARGIYLLDVTGPARAHTCKLAW